MSFVGVCVPSVILPIVQTSVIASEEKIKAAEQKINSGQAIRNEPARQFFVDAISMLKDEPRDSHVNALLARAWIGRGNSTPDWDSASGREEAAGCFRAAIQHAGTLPLLECRARYRYGKLLLAMATDLTRPDEERAFCLSAAHKQLCKAAKIGIGGQNEKHKATEMANIADCSNIATLRKNIDAYHKDEAINGKRNWHSSQLWRRS